MSDPFVAVEVQPSDLAALEVALVVLEEAGVKLVRVPQDSPIGPAGPLFRIYEADSSRPGKYVFYMRIRPGRGDA